MTDRNNYCVVQSIFSYYPSVGDLLIWSGWFSTWYGFLEESKQKETCVFVFSALPILLVSDDKSLRHIREIKLKDLRNSKNGKFAILRNSSEYEKPIWFI